MTFAVKSIRWTDTRPKIDARLNQLEFIGTLKLVEHKSHLGKITKGTDWHGAIGDFTGWSTLVATGTNLSWQ